MAFVPRYVGRVWLQVYVPPRLTRTWRGRPVIMTLACSASRVRAGVIGWDAIASL